MSEKSVNIKSRILEYIARKGITKEKFFRKIEMTSANFRGKALKSKLNTQAIEKILSEFDDINPNWLISGHGEMLIDWAEVERKQKRIPRKDRQQYAGDEMQEYMSSERNGPDAVPYYDIDVSAGMIEVFGNPEETPTGWVNFPGFPKSDAIVNAYGDSMSDYICNGDKIAIRQINDMELIDYGQTYVIVTEDFRLVKFIQKSTEKGTVKLASYNKFYDSYDIPKDKILSLFLVTYVFKQKVN